MNRIKWPSVPIPNWIGVLFLLFCFALMLSVAGAVFWLFNFAWRVLPALQVKDQETLVFSDLKDVESGQRGYLLTGDPEYLFQYVYGARAVRSDMRMLYAYVSDRPTELRIFMNLSETVDKKLREVDSTIKEYKTVGQVAAVSIVKTNTGLELMNQIRDQFDELRAVERNTLRKNHLVGP